MWFTGIDVVGRWTSRCRSKSKTHFQCELNCFAVTFYEAAMLELANMSFLKMLHWWWCRRLPWELIMFPLELSTSAWHEKPEYLHLLFDVVAHIERLNIERCSPLCFKAATEKSGRNAHLLHAHYYNVCMCDHLWGFFYMLELKSMTNNYTQNKTCYVFCWDAH